MSYSHEAENILLFTWSEHDASPFGILLLTQQRATYLVSSA